MKHILKLTEEEKLVKEFFDIILREMGPMETVRFFTMAGKKKWDIDKSYREWQKKANTNFFLADMISNILYKVND